MRTGTGTTLDKYNRTLDVSLKTALVFTGGGSRGAVEVGALKAIANRIRPDAVIGTSVGAINAAFYAAGVTPMELERLWLRLTSHFVFPINWDFIWRPWKARSISHSGNLKRFLSDNLPVKTFEECQIPLYINATALRTGKSVFFSSGNIIEAVLASVAIPPYYPPHVISGAEYVDGGVSNVIAIDEAKALKCNQVIAVSTYESRSPDSSGTCSSCQTTSFTWSSAASSTTSMTSRPRASRTNTSRSSSRRYPPICRSRTSATRDTSLPSAKKRPTGCSTISRSSFPEQEV